MSNLLTTHPLLSVALTLVVFAGAQCINARSKGHPLANSVLLSAAVIIALLSLTDTPYEEYFSGAQFIHLLLGPAVVALAVPLSRHLYRLSRIAAPVLIGIAAGCASGVVSIVLLAWALGADGELAAALATKSVTAPVSMAITSHIGGVPALAAVASVLTGMLGAAFGPRLLDRLGVSDPMLRGLAMGTASHGQGTARILQESEEAGAFAALAMGLTALAMAMLLPLLARVAL